MKNIIKLFLILLIMWPLYAQSQEPPPRPTESSKVQQNRPTQKKTNGNTDHQITNKRPSAIKEGPTQTPDTKKKDQAKNVNQSPPEDWSLFNVLLIVFNALLAAFTFLLWWSTNKMWKSTKDAADAAKKAADALPAVERAYIFVKIEPLRNLQDGSSITINVSVMMKNYGRTPAMLNNIYGVITLRDARVHEALEIQIPPGFILGTDIDETNPCPYQVSIHLRDAEWQCIEMEKVPAFCCGVIKYEDIFHVAHETGFCWEYSSTAHKWFISGKYKDLNYHT